MLRSRASLASFPSTQQPLALAVPRTRAHLPTSACHAVLLDSSQLAGVLDSVRDSVCSAAATPLNLFGAGAACAAAAAAAAPGPASAVQLDIAADMQTSEIWYPVSLSLLAGLSTSIGGLIAVALSPDEGTLAFLLGTAIGVMATVSGVELWWHSAAQLQDTLGVTSAVLGGAALFAVLDPLLPKPPEAEELLEPQQQQLLLLDREQAPALAGSDRDQQHPTQQRSAHHTDQHSVHDRPQRMLREMGSKEAAVAQAAAGALQQAKRGAGMQHSSSHARQQQHQHQHQPPPQQQHQDMRAASEQQQRSSDSTLQQHYDDVTDAVMDIQPPLARDQKEPSNSSSSSDSLRAPQHQAVAAAAVPPAGIHHRQSLLRLSLLMGITMTLHNLPEGVAVAFSAFTDLGPIMVLAIGLHNLPEGLICAAPLYAATGNKWQAVGLATASGLSEPLGALLALLLLKPFVRSLAALDYVLAATGGVMLAVCVLELWPEGRRCGRDGRLLAGVLLGTAVMGWTLYVGV